MSTLLQITSSITGDNSHSNTLSNAFTERWKAENPQGEVIVRDLARHSPHLDSTRLQALFTPEDKRTAEQQAVVDYSDTLIAELRNADTIVIGIPFYNFGIPSSLKAYFDHIARAGVTFQYTANGPEGLLPDVPVYLFSARGGHYAGGPADWQVNTFLQFIGFNNVKNIYAEGLALGEESVSKAVTTARREIDALFA